MRNISNNILSRFLNTRPLGEALTVLHDCWCKKIIRLLEAILAVSMIALLFYGSSCRQPQPADNVLAMAGERIITVSDFKKRYESIRTRMNLPDNIQVRKELLRTMLEEELLISEAVRQGYRDDPISEFEEQRIKIQQLLDAYLREEVFSKITVSDDELKTLFLRLNTKVKARHLYAATRKGAEALYTELLHGESFEALAEENFTDRQLRPIGGSLGYFTVDEMDPAFEEVAFTLDIGQISHPVRTARGYSIIQVQDRITKPLVTESEYLKHRADLEHYWLYRKKKRATQQYVDSLRRELAISFNDSVVSELFNIVKEKMPESEERTQNFTAPGKLKNKVLLHSRLGDWDVQTFYEYARYTSDEQLNWIRNRENLEDFIAGILVRAWIIEQAKQAGLHETPDYALAVCQKLEDFLLERMQQTISDATVIPEDTLYCYYQQNKELFTIPPKIYLRAIFLDSEKRVTELEQQLRNRVAFETLAKEYSVRPSAGQGGDIGAFTYAELGKFADRIFPLEPGQWRGPLQIGNQFAFFECYRKDAAETQTFDAALPEIKKTLHPVYRRDTRQRLLNRIRKDVEVVTYPEKLESIQLN